MKRPILALLVALLAPPAAAAEPPSMDALWADLEKREADAARALLKMEDRPDEAVAFLKANLKPLTLDPERAMALIVKLESKDDKVWKPAFEELEYFDPRLAIDLVELMNEVNAVPARHRMVEVLSGREPNTLKQDEEVTISPVGDGFNFRQQGSWWAENKIERINAYAWVNPKKKWTRAVRAIVLLEHIGTPEARAILKDMAAGHADAQPTRAAIEALANLERVADPQ